ncbi:MAG: helix-turn-helix transcriptional regulator [Dehalococcoidia bacterium]
MPDMLLRIDRSGRYLEFKPARDFEPHVPPAEFLGRRTEDVLPPDVAAVSKALIVKAIDTGEPQVHVYQLAKDDQLRDYEARIVPLGAGEVLAIVRDITEGGIPARPRVGASQGYGLSKREHAVLRLVAIGLTDKEIGLRLDISAMTVSKHLGSIRKKMVAQSRTEASVRAVKEGLLD